mmetsp:Transcript_5916/g.13602  ORF Transcript_5916/g.13602 Transcript_5916/m.13602 type:complete len:308 (+) Transcript_5916:150-1073(+)
MDRLQQLKKGAAVEDVSVDVEEDSVLISPTGRKTGTDGMQEFFGDVEIVKANIMVIREATRKIAEINQNVLQATTSDRESDYSHELEPLVKSTNKKASVAKQLLQRLREDTESMKTEQGSKQTPEIRIRENLANTLTRKFVDVMKEYQNAQTKYKTDIKKKVKRQVQIVKPDATSEEIDAVFKSGGGSGQVLKSAILTGAASDSIQNAFQTVADKYQDVLTLEASVMELHQMFLDFALLTEKQGELLDQIEHQVQEAGDYIDQGNTELVSAIQLAKSIQYKRLCCCILMLVLIGILLAVLASQGIFN